MLCPTTDPLLVQQQTFLSCRIDDESEFFTLAGSLLATGTGSIAFISQQAKAKSKKRRRSEAAATDATPSESPAAAIPTSALPDPASDKASAKARRKAAKQLRKAAEKGSARAAAPVGAVPEQAPAATAPDNTRWSDDREVAGKLEFRSYRMRAISACLSTLWLFLLVVLLHRNPQGKGRRMLLGMIMGATVPKSSLCFLSGLLNFA